MARISKIIAGLMVILGSTCASTMMAQLPQLPGTIPNDTIIKNKERKVFFGLKGGFTSSLFLNSKLMYNQYSVSNLQNNYKIGFVTSAFAQFNFKHIFIQPELGYSIDNGELMFALPISREGRGNNMEYVRGKINSTIHSIDFPVYLGYHIINNKPYKLSIFAGPKLRACINKKTKIDIDINGVDYLQEKLYPVLLNATAGISVTISNIFFDFQYDIGLHNISKSIAPLQNVDFDQSKLQTITIKRRYNVLSFSIGVFL